jgi:hypothetical protein
MGRSGRAIAQERYSLAVTAPRLAELMLSIGGSAGARS